MTQSFKTKSLKLKSNSVVLKNKIKGLLINEKKESAEEKQKRVDERE